MKTPQFRKSATNFCVKTWAAAVKNRVKEERRKRKINQQEMADLLNISLRTYQDKENGKPFRGAFGSYSHYSSNK